MFCLWPYTVKCIGDLLTLKITGNKKQVPGFKTLHFVFEALKRQALKHGRGKMSTVQHETVNKGGMELHKIIAT